MFKIIAIVTVMIATPAFGYDEDTGEIEAGDTIESYSYDTGEYTEIEVNAVEQRGGTTVIETYDWDTGTYTEMEIKGR